MTPSDRSRRGGAPGGERRGGRGGAIFRGRVGGRGPETRAGKPSPDDSGEPRPQRSRAPRRDQQRTGISRGAGSDERRDAGAGRRGGAGSKAGAPSARGVETAERSGVRSSRREPKRATGEERVQKILATAGLGSRRACEDLIRAGQVTINGQIAALGAKADPARDSIKVAGKRVWVSSQHRYLVLNKPRGFVTTVRDPEGRPTVIDLVPERLRRGLRPVGRLDFETEGLLLLTDDGDFALRVSHPRYGCKKTYEVKVKGMPDEPSLDKLRRGIPLEGRLTAPSEIRPRLGVRRRAARARHTDPGRGSQPRDGARGRHGRDEQGGRERGRGRSRSNAHQESLHNSWWVVRLAEGRSRQIREMFQRIGHPVQKLRRVAIGPLRDARLTVGSWRELTADEVQRLLETSR